MDAVISLKEASKYYYMGNQIVRALHKVSLDIHPNEYVAVMGPSGSGKSTMMNIVGCLDTVTSGN